MEQKNLYSIRMRASSGELHISGAERIVSQDRIEATAGELIARAMGKNRKPDRITVGVESLKDAEIRRLTALDVVTIAISDVNSGRTAAADALQRAGVSAKAAAAAIKYISTGAAPSGNNMRGAMIMDADTGERLEPDRERGVRVSRFDWSDDALEKIRRRLAGVGLIHFRTREALALATKAAHAPGIAAELCWSDDPDYVAGYVASLAEGYVRFPLLKESGDNRGGRAFFVKTGVCDIDMLVKYLQEDAVLVSDTGKCRPEMEPAEYFSG